MPSPYPRELRERALAAYDRGWTQPEVCVHFDIARTTLVTWLALRRETGGLDPMPHSGGAPIRVRFDVLEQVLVDLPDGTREELTKLYNSRVARRERVHASSVYRALRRGGYVVKKNVRGQRSRTGRT
jgi:transposase